MANVDSAASSPYTILAGDLIANGKFVGLRPGAYDPGISLGTVYGILPGAPVGKKIVNVTLSAHYVEVVGGKSGGVKLCELTATGMDDAKVNEPAGLGVYGIRKLEIDEVGNSLTFEACLSDGSAAFPLQWHYATISLANTPLAGLKAFTDVNLAAVLGTSVGGGSGDASAIHDGDVVKVTKVS